MAGSQQLLDSLSNDQLHLVEIIARPWMVGNMADSLGWPTWDFVRRRFRTNRASAPDANEVLGSLPVVVSPSFTNGSYSLWWRTEPRAGALRPEERVGLTIAGLSHLRAEKANHQAPDLAAICLDIVTRAAQEERALGEEQDWWEVASGEFDLRRDRLSGQGDPVEIVGQVLVHEFRPLAVPSTNYNYLIRYGNDMFAPFAHADSVEQYLAVAARLASADAESDLPVSPLALPAALDYLGLAVRVHPRWDVREPLVDLPGFEAAASVAQLPGTRAEFDQRCSDLWNIVGRLRAPRGSDEDYRARNWDPTAKRSLNNLVIWLENELGCEEYEVVCTEAVKVLKAVGKIRQESQHRSQTTSANREDGLTLMGLPSLVTDWPAAWSAVLHRCADAVHAITLAIRRAETR